MAAAIRKKSQKEWHMLAYVIFFSYLCSRIVYDVRGDAWMDAIY